LKHYCRLAAILSIFIAFILWGGCKSDSPTKPPDLQIAWDKYETNPVVHGTNPVTEFYAIGQPTCLWENDTIKMWYAAGGLPFITSRILYAWSSDGIEWTKYGSGSAVMEAGGTGSWDIWVDTPEIIHNSAGYKMYYFGDTLPGGSNLKPSGLASIGVATSNDGINWTKYSNNPVLSRGDSSDWDRSWIESPAVLWDSAAGIYLMWYTGIDTTQWRISIGLATSPDGFVWTKYSGNPVLRPGSPGSYDDMWAATPAVIKNNGRYEMWYSGFSSTTGYTNLTMNFATSTDGIHWTKFSGNPLFDTHTSPYSNAVDSGGPWAPDVIYDGSQYKMWYETLAGFCLATSNGKIIEQ
jgi:predicted GH43/DUF377 family glycosyl hydrolase